MMEHAPSQSALCLRLIASLCADLVDGGRRAVISEVADQIRDWDLFVALLDRHRVFGVVHAAVSGDRQWLPGGIYESISKRAAADARHNLAMAAETARLHRLFEDEGLAAIFFKGAALSQRAYGSLTVKYGKDIDFVVRAEALPRCMALLEREGYELRLPRPVLDERQWQAVLSHEMEVVMVHSRSGIQLEPHWKIVPNARLLRIDDLFAAAGTDWDRIGNLPVRTLHPDDQFAYLAAHGAVSGWFRLKWLADFHAFLGNAAPAEIERLFRHAEQRGVGPSAAVALSLCKDQFDREIPAMILRQVDRRWTLRLLRRLSLRSLRSPGQAASIWRSFLVQLTIAAAHGYFFRELFRWRTSLEDRLDFPLPRPLRFLYPLLRLPLWIRRRLAPSTRSG